MSIIAEPSTETAEVRHPGLCAHEHVEQVGTDALGRPITECLTCGDGAGELITDPAEIEQIKARLQYNEGQYDIDVRDVRDERATAAEVRHPAYRYHDIRPAGGVPLTEWAIERQLSLAADYGQQDLVDVLVAMNPDLDESIALDIERLLDTAESVRDAELNGTRAQHDWCIDEYATQLRKLARLVRGARS